MIAVDIHVNLRPDAVALPIARRAADADEGEATGKAAAAGFVSEGFERLLDLAGSHLKILVRV